MTWQVMARMTRSTRLEDDGDSDGEVGDNKDNQPDPQKAVEIKGRTQPESLDFLTQYHHPLDLDGPNWYCVDYKQILHDSIPLLLRIPVPTVPHPIQQHDDEHDNRNTNKKHNTNNTSFKKV